MDQLCQMCSCLPGACSSALMALSETGSMHLTPPPHPPSSSSPKHSCMVHPILRLTHLPYPSACLAVCLLVSSTSFQPFVRTLSSSSSSFPTFLPTSLWPSLPSPPPPPPASPAPQSNPLSVLTFTPCTFFLLFLLPLHSSSSPLVP